MILEKPTKEQVGSFLSGSNQMERVIKIECSYNEDEVSIIYRDSNGTKRIRKDAFKPFVWVTQSGARQMFNGNRFKLKDSMSRHGIGCTGLATSNGVKEAPERMKNGYNVMFFSREKKSYNDFMRFFRESGVPIYPKPSDKNYGLKYFVAISPVEQYMIQTGIRLFKGYDDYDDIVRMEWDLETEGLDPNIHMISQIGLRTNNGFERIITIDGETPEEKFDNEMSGIREMFEIVKREKPDVMTGHNTENFDWVFIDTRLRKHGTSLGEFSLDFFPNGIYKKDKQAVLKLGGEVEYYYPTVFWGTNITDSLHAVRRAQALDSTMKKADLKYVTRFSKLNKPNRVYVPGKAINKVWEDLTDTYAFNNENGDWHKITERKPLLENYQKVTGRYIVQRYLLDDLYEGDKVEARYNQSNFLVGKMLPLSFERACTMGTASIWKSIMMAWSYEHGLGIPLAEPSRAFTGGLSRLIMCGFVENVAKFDYNSLYPSIILSFDMHIKVDVMDVMPTMLEYILTQREYYKGLKKKYSKQAAKIEDEKREYVESLRTLPQYAQLDDKEFGKAVSALKEIHDYNQRIQEAKSLSSKNDKMQLPLKILGNSWFGSVSSGVFYWDDIDIGEQITCTGRQMYRLLNHHFMKKGYKPIVGDTDGCNFQIPKVLEYTEEHPYISNGAGRNSVKGKAYTGIDADVREFEDMYLWGKNGLDIDEVVPSSINFKRKTYADLLEDGSVKLVGNSIKSKKMSLYIEKFLDVAIRQLLENKGEDFLNFYYDYIEKIYNYRIPLKEIASVGKIKTSIETYKEECKKLTKAGTKKSRQAWYELAIKHGLNVNMGDTIYYINTGKKKSDSDIRRETHYSTYENGNEVDATKTLKREYDKLKKEEKNGNTEAYEKLSKGEDGARGQMSFTEYVKRYYSSYKETDELIFNCELVPNEIIEDEEDHFCDDDFEYNVEKYVEMLNKRITTLLVCFHPDMRNKVNEKGQVVSNILITNPKDRKYFTNEESRLVSGFPANPADQDDIEDVLTMEDREIAFWIRKGLKPAYIDECGKDWEAIKADYLERMEEEKANGMAELKDAFYNAFYNIKESDLEKFLEEGSLPAEISGLCYFDGKTNSFVSKKYDVPICKISEAIDWIKNTGLFFETENE